MTMFTDPVLDHSNVFFHSSTSSEEYPVMTSSHRGEGVSPPGVSPLGFPSWWVYEPKACDFSFLCMLQEAVAIPSNPLITSVHWGGFPSWQLVCEPQKKTSAFYVHPRRRWLPSPTPSSNPSLAHHHKLHPTPALPACTTVWTTHLHHPRVWPFCPTCDIIMTSRFNELL